MPKLSSIQYIEEPWVRLYIEFPNKYLHCILSICSIGIQEGLRYGKQNVILVCKFPLNEIIFGLVFVC